MNQTPRGSGSQLMECVRRDRAAPLEEVIQVVPLLDNVAVLRGGRCLQRRAHVRRLGRRLGLLLDRRLVEGEHLLALGLELPRELGELEDALRLRARELGQP